MIKPPINNSPNDSLPDNVRLLFGEPRANDHLTGDRRANGSQHPAPNGVGPDGWVEAARTLEHHMNVQHNLCVALETLADGLPAEVRSDDCLAIARSVYPIVHRSHLFEERELFPMLKGQFGADAEISEILDRLHGEHWEDEAFAEEVHHELTAFAADRSSVNADKLGYMLRGFFVGLRRHLAFERDFLVPMLRQAEAG